MMYCANFLVRGGVADIGLARAQVEAHKVLAAIHFARG